MDAKTADFFVIRHGEMNRHLQVTRERPYADDFEDPPYTTIQCAMIEGGTAVNIVAGACSFDFDVRYLPGHNPYDRV